MSKLTSKIIDTKQLDVLTNGAPAIIWCDELRGFGARISPPNTRFPNGKISYLVQKRQGGRQTKQIRFTFDAQDVNCARDKALTLLSDIRNGGNPSLERKDVLSQRRREYHAFKTQKFKDIFEQYRLARSNGAYYWERDIVYAWNKHILPVVGNRAVTEITKDDIRALLMNIKGAVAAKKAQDQLKPFFKYLMQEDIITANPFDSIASLPKGKSRDRVLTKDELIAFWKATGDIIAKTRPQYGYMFRVLLLTAARLREIAHLESDEVSFTASRITIPAKRAKSKRSHIIPLGDLAVDVLQQVPRRHNQFVFSYGKRKLGGFSMAKSTLDREMRKYLGDNFKPWHSHDLRHTFATIMAEQGCNPDIIDRCLSHLAKSQEGVRGVYQRFEFIKERTEVMNKWNNYIAELCK